MSSSCSVMEDVNPELTEACQVDLKGGQIILILGKRGSGKSVHLFRLIELFHKERPSMKVNVIGLPFNKKRHLPKWCGLVSKLEEVPDSSILAVDEAGIMFTATHKKDTLLNLMLELARHKNLTIIFANINASNINLDIIRSIDILVIHEPSLLQSALERRGVNRLVKKAKEEFDKVPKSERIHKAYVISKDCESLIDVELPKFWSESLSISWGDDVKSPKPKKTPK